MQQKLSSLLSSQALELEPLYQRLADSTSEEERADVQNEIAQMQNRHKREEEAINREIYQTGIKETAIEMEVKRLDTQITTLQKQLEAVEEAESAAIDRATPKFKGVG